MLGIKRNVRRLTAEEITRRMVEIQGKELDMKRFVQQSAERAEQIRVASLPTHEDSDIGVGDEDDDMTSSFHSVYGKSEENDYEMADSTCESMSKSCFSYFLLSC